MSLLGTVKAASALAKANPAGFALSVLRVIWPYLLLLALTLGAAWWIWSSGYEKAQFDDAARMGELTAERDRANSQRDGALAANGTLAQSEAALRNALAEASAENTRLGNARAAALLEAEAARAKSELTFGQWRERYASTLGAPTCKAALAAMARACPVKEF